MIGSAQMALRRGQEFLRSGEKAAAQAWLDRAYRLAPEDSSVRLLLASTLAGADEPRCRTVLLSLLADYPAFREARIALCAAELRTGAHEAAVSQLSGLLCSAAPPDSANFRQLADQVAQRAKAAGWIGVDGRGHLQVSLQPRSAAGRLAVLLDGQAAWSRRVGGGEAGWFAPVLPVRWKQAAELTATLEGQPLLGSGIDLVRLRRVQGFVEMTADGQVSGWAWHPADPEMRAVLTVTPVDGLKRAEIALQVRADDDSLPSSSEDGPARLRGFAVPAAKIPTGRGVRITGPDGDELLGSPVYPFAEQLAARAAAAALATVNRGRPARGRSAGAAKPVDIWRPLAVTGVVGGGAFENTSRPVPARRPVDVVMPVYRGVSDFTACLASLQRRWPASARLVVVDDGSPDGDLRAELSRGAAAGSFVLLRHARNRGFPAAANTGMRAAFAPVRGAGRAGGNRDVVLLNPDTLLPPGWLERLVAAAYSAGDIGSVTPLTNQGTIVAYPTPNEDNAAPDLEQTDRLDALMRAANGRGRVELPTAVGFCMFIRHDCLAEVGLFREDVFAQGYGEENDWCLRARQLGWRHMAATGVFVAHHGGRSFGAGRRHLLARNGTILARLHPGYDRLIADFAARDPLRPARFRADARRWAERRGENPGPAVLLITHDAGGGVERFVSEHCGRLREAGRRPVLLRPVRRPPAASGGAVSGPDEAPAFACRVSEGYDDDFPNLRFELPTEIDALLMFLHAEALQELELHHLLGHAPEMSDVIDRLGLPYRVFIHDYSYWCPRITLCTRGARYCGEPLDPRECDACVADVGRRSGPEVPVAQLRAASGRLLKGAVEVVVPCEDVAGRMARHFRGLRTQVMAWEDDAALQREHAAAPGAASRRLLSRRGEVRVLVVGAIGADKGYEVLLGCVRDAARRRLAMHFTVVGYTMDDNRLLEAGPVFVTGAFEEAEAVALAAAQQAHIGFIPSIWPETWCYALSTVWRAGLLAVAFGFGAPAQRILRTGLGAVLPVGLAVERINDALVQIVADQSGAVQAAG